MSAREPARRQAFLRTVLHPTLAASLPFLFLVLVTELIRSVIPVPLSAWAYLLVLLAGVEEVVVGNILLEERVGSFERVREPLYLLLFAGLVLLAFEGGPLRARPAALMRPEIVYLGALVLLEWLVCWRIHQGLRDREFLEAALEGREGPALQVALRDNAELARSAIAAVPQTKHLIFAFQFLAFAAVVALFGAGVRVPAAATALFVLHAAAGIVAVAVLNNAAEDQLLAAEGVTLTAFYRRRRLIYVLAILAVAGLLVALYARGSSLLPLEVFRPFLEWLSRLLSRRRRMRPFGGTSPAMPRPDLELLRQLQRESEEPGPLLELLRFLLRVIWNVLRLTLAALLAYFLLAPLLSRTFRQRLRALRPLDYLRDQLRRLLAVLAAMLRDLLGWLRREPGRRAGGRRGRGRRWRSRLALRRPGLFKLWEMGTVLRAYARLVRWGQRQGVRFRFALGPREYLTLVAAARPADADLLAEAAAILEESLYCQQRAGREKVQRYLRIVKGLTRAR